MYETSEPASRDVTVRALYTVQPDGTNKRPLLANGQMNTRPMFSPDGSQIVFVSSAPGSRDAHIYVMRADGSQVRQLTTGVGVNSWPSWTPDGHRILFSSNRDNNGGFGQLYVTTADGTDVARLTTNGAYWDTAPRMSPDGRWIVYSSVRPGARCLYVMRADGTESAPIPNTCNASLSDAVWSPDGTRLATSEIAGRASNGFNDTRRIITIRPTGEDKVAVTTGTDVIDGAPAWSPDGARLVFVRTTPNGVHLGLYTVPAAGGEATVLVPTPGFHAFGPHWGR